MSYKLRVNILMSYVYCTSYELQVITSYCLLHELRLMFNHEL